MAKEKLVKNITSRDEDFAQWYTDVVREANLCDQPRSKARSTRAPAGYSQTAAAAGMFPARSYIGLCKLALGTQLFK